MNLFLMMTLGIAMIAAGYVALPVFVDSYRRFRGRHMVICPETERANEIALDARHAALTSIVGRPRFRVTECSRWPEHRDCDQDCIRHMDQCAMRETHVS